MGQGTSYFAIVQSAWKWPVRWVTIDALPDDLSRGILVPSMGCESIVDSDGRRMCMYALFSLPFRLLVNNWSFHASQPLLPNFSPDWLNSSGLRHTRLTGFLRIQTSIAQVSLTYGGRTGVPSVFDWLVVRVVELRVSEFLGRSWSPPTSPSVACALTHNMGAVRVFVQRVPSTEACPWLTSGSASPHQIRSRRPASSLL